MAYDIQAVYLGSALNHLRSYEVWVPNTSAPWITNTVWWFLKNLQPDETLLQPDATAAYPPTRARPNPRDNGSDLIGRNFVEPELGICAITETGPVVHKPLTTRAQMQQHRRSLHPSTPITPGAHYTLRYQQRTTGEEHYSSVAEVLQWIALGPFLPPPPAEAGNPAARAPITTPGINIPSIGHTRRDGATATVAEPGTRFNPTNAIAPDTTPTADEQRVVADVGAQARNQRRWNREEQRVSFQNEPPNPQTRGEQRVQDDTIPPPRRTSARLSAHMAHEDADEPMDEPLRPRPQWMRDARSDMTEAEADRHWREVSEHMFGPARPAKPGAAYAVPQRGAHRTPDAWSYPCPKPTCNPCDQADPST
jgi:hypothetical protein